MVKPIKNTLRLAAVGGFGHAVCVFDELAEAGDCGVELIGLAPGYQGEDVSEFAAHPWVRNSAANIYSDAAALLAAAKPDVLVVSTRLDQIPVVARQGLAAGCHLILEKPVAMTRSEVRVLCTEARRRNLCVMAMLSMRSLPAFIVAKKAIESGAVGEPVLINTRKSYKWGQRPEWFNDRALYSGTWPWVGIHGLDIADFLTGKRVLRVQADQANLAHPDYPNCEDVCTGLFELEGGTRLLISVDLCRPADVSTHGDDWARVVGTKGVIEVNASTGICQLIRSDRPPEDLPIGDGTGPIYMDFFKGLGKLGSRFDATAFYLTDVALAAREAASSGGTVDLQMDDFFNVSPGGN